MNTIEFLPGTTINNLGTVQRLHFTDLFEAHYVINDECYSSSQIKNEIINNKDVILKKLLILLDTNQTLAFKFLNKLMLKTKNIPLMNSLNSQLIVLKNTINDSGFEWSHYTDYQSTKQHLKTFLFTYYTKKLD